LTELWRCGDQAETDGHDRLIPRLEMEIEAWVNDLDSTTAAPLLSVYEDATALSNTYVVYSSDATLTKDNDYIRIDRARMWIEFCVQQGVAFSTSYYFHALWRDKTADYGGDFQVFLRPCHQSSAERPKCQRAKR
jgi:hypothetical protein